MRNSLAALAAVVMLAGSAAAQMRARDLAEVKPEAVGFSTERLQRLHALLEQKVEEKELAGIVTVLARHGKVVELRTYGKKDLASGAPMDADAIFRIYSMTKPITGVAMMQLYEQGKWSPGDPIAKYIPEFKDLKVYKGADANGKILLEEPAHAPTMAELMSHTAGFTYGIFGDSPVDQLYRNADLFNRANLQEMIERMAKIPLVYQPGTRWVYSLSVDIQGFIVEKISGKPLGTYFRDEIFQPLGMKDSGFHVDQAKVGRVATMYSANPAGQLVAAKADPSMTKEPGMPSGGGGLFSTARDYLRFAQMLLNGGEFGGARILAPSSVQLMRTNRLPQSIVDAEKFGIGFFHLSPGFGFGYDFGVFTDPGRVGRTVGKGTYTWEGAAGTWFWVDPANDVVFVGMIHRMMGAGNPDMSTLTQQAVYQALVNPEK